MSNLFERKKFRFDEDDMFSHSHDKRHETKKFPWYKPVWNETAKEWDLVNPDGKVLTFEWLGVNMPGYKENMEKARKYELFSTFFVDWVKKLVHYQYAFNWNDAYNNAKAENPTLNDQKWAKMADATMNTFFENMK